MAQPFVAVVNLGCRVNRVESDKITTDLLRAGCALVDPDEADIVVINTCAVTGEAEAKTRKAVRRALGYPRSPFVVLTGCSVALHAEELAALSERVIIEPLKSEVVDHVLAKVGARAGSAEPFHPHEIASILGRVRLGVKIQDGCNHRCTFCIVWKARGEERSIPVESVIQQIQELEQAGIPEAVLTGVNLGAYDGLSDQDAHVELDELVEEILERTSIPHIRISSIEPMDVSDRLVRVMAAHPDRVAPFLHLPIQSGCTQTLRRMARPYTAQDVAEQVARFRSILPSLALSGDVIVGFPGETNDEFEESCRMLSEIQFSRLHVFRYSPRPGTPAASMEHQVDGVTQAQRSAVVRALAQQGAQRDASMRIGSVENVVVEQPGFGTTGSFYRIRLVDGDPEPSSLVRAQIVDVEASGSNCILVGSVLSPKEG